MSCCPSIRLRVRSLLPGNQVLLVAPGPSVCGRMAASQIEVGINGLKSLCFQVTRISRSRSRGKYLQTLTAPSCYRTSNSRCAAARFAAGSKGEFHAIGRDRGDHHHSSPARCVLYQGRSKLQIRQRNSIWIVPVCAIGYSHDVSAPTQPILPDRCHYTFSTFPA